MDYTALVIVSASGAAGLLLGNVLATWLLQIYHHLGLLKRENFLKHYDRFASKEAFNLMSKIQSAIPQNYQVYQRFHKDNRQQAYPVHIKRMLRLAVLSIALPLACFITLISLATSHRVLYLTFFIVITLHIAYKIKMNKENRKFYLLVATGAILTKLSLSEHR